MCKGAARGESLVKKSRSAVTRRICDELERWMRQKCEGSNHLLKNRSFGNRDPPPLEEMDQSPVDFD